MAVFMEAVALEVKGSTKWRGAKVCPECGRPVDVEWRYCPYCGKALG